MPKRKRETKQEEVEEEKIDKSDEIANKELKEAKEEVKEETKTDLKEIKTDIEAEKPKLETLPLKTSLGKKIIEGKITSIDQIFLEGLKIREPEIVDLLLPDMSNEIILVGGSGGKGGGIRRTLSRRTTRMHKSGRRYRISVMTAVGNQNGYLGVGLAKGPASKHKEVVEKSLRRAKLNLFPIKRGCGSWECGCGSSHSIPFTTTGKCGSVIVKLNPAPKGIGLCASNEIKKIMRLAGINDIWFKTRGQFRTRINFVNAIIDALKKLNTIKTIPEQEKNVGLRLGKVE